MIVNRGDLIVCQAWKSSAIINRWYHNIEIKRYPRVFLVLKTQNLDMDDIVVTHLGQLVFDCSQTKSYDVIRSK